MKNAGPRGALKPAPDDRAALPLADGDGIAYFRLCHLCFHLNESATGVYRCERCGRILTLDRVPQNLSEAIEQYFETEMKAEPESSEDGPEGEGDSDGSVWVSADETAAGEEPGEEPEAEDDEDNGPEESPPDGVPLNGLSVVW